ncbi:MAG: helix-turn-helix domain-containing protein [Syntrophomonas sp.]
MDNILGNRLRKAREKKGFSQKFVAESLGITNSSLSNYERGERDPDTSILNRLADLYEVTMDYLFGRNYVDVKVNVDPDKIKDLSDVDKLAEELIQSLNKALTDGVITEDQARQSLEVFRQTLTLIIEAKNRK